MPFCLFSPFSSLSCTAVSLSVCRVPSPRLSSSKIGPNGLPPFLSLYLSSFISITFHHYTIHFLFLIPLYLHYPSIPLFSPNLSFLLSSTFIHILFYPLPLSPTITLLSLLSYFLSFSLIPIPSTFYINSYILSLFSSFFFPKLFHYSLINFNSIYIFFFFFFFFFIFLFFLILLLIIFMNVCKLIFYYIIIKNSLRRWICVAAQTQKALAPRGEGCLAVPPWLARHGRAISFRYVSPSATDTLGSDNGAPPAKPTGEELGTWN